MSEARDPRTIDEWQEAAVAAAGARMIEDARIYGLVRGGPAVDVERCDWALTEAAAIGVVPTREEATQAALDIIVEHAEEVSDGG